MDIVGMDKMKNQSEAKRLKQQRDAFNIDLRDAFIPEFLDRNVDDYGLLGHLDQMPDILDTLTHERLPALTKADDIHLFYSEALTLAEEFGTGDSLAKKLVASGLALLVGEHTAERARATKSKALLALSTRSFNWHEALNTKINMTTDRCQSDNPDKMTYLGASFCVGLFASWHKYIPASYLPRVEQSIALTRTYGSQLARRNFGEFANVIGCFSNTLGRNTTTAQAFRHLVAEELRTLYATDSVSALYKAMELRQALGPSHQIGKMAQRYFLKKLPNILADDSPGSAQGIDLLFITLVEKDIAPYKLYRDAARLLSRPVIWGPERGELSGIAVPPGLRH